VEGTLFRISRPRGLSAPQDTARCQPNLTDDGPSELVQWKFVGAFVVGRQHLSSSPIITSQNPVAFVDARVLGASLKQCLATILPSALLIKSRCLRPSRYFKSSIPSFHHVVTLSCRPCPSKQAPKSALQRLPSFQLVLHRTAGTSAALDLV